MMTPAELRARCRSVRSKQTPVDEELVAAIEREAARYRERLRTTVSQLPPDDLAQLLPLLGWLMYEASLMLLWDVEAGFESFPEERAARSRSCAGLIERLADAARALPWPEYAPRALGTIRAQALVESKRDTVAGYDAAWVLHEEARLKHQEYLDSHGDSPRAAPFALALDEVLLQLALAETGTACRTAEQVIGRWIEEREHTAADVERREADRWVHRMFRQLSDGAEVGERALAIGGRIHGSVGFVDSVDEHRLALRSAFRYPAIMTCRALLLLYSLCPAMERLGMRPPGFGTWPEYMASLRDRFHAALAYFRRPVVSSDGTPVPLLGDHARAIVQCCLHLALLAAQESLDAPLPIDDTLSLHRLDDAAALAMARWLTAPTGSDGRPRGDANVIGSASMPRFIQSVEACRSDAAVTANYRQWRRDWPALDRYGPDRWPRIEEMLDRVSKGDDW